MTKWQEAHGFPFEFSTEASVNLADDPDLLRMLGEANFFGVFIGIESPDPETLAQTQKKQNTRRDLSASIHRIYQAGLCVVAGFIVGFDSERASVEAPITALIEEFLIPIAMVGLFYALPNTQLTRRLEREGRLFVAEARMEDGEVPGDQCTAGLDFVTKRARRDALTDYRMILSRIYSPASFFGRVRRVGAALRIPARTPAVNLRLALREFGAVFAPHVWYHDRQARYASARLVDVGLHREAQPFGNTSCHADVGHICSPRSLLALRHRQDRRADPGA